jgi:hypothetical protein
VDFTGEKIFVERFLKEINFFHPTFAGVHNLRVLLLSVHYRYRLLDVTGGRDGRPA